VLDKTFSGFDRVSDLSKMGENFMIVGDDFDGTRGYGTGDIQNLGTTYLQVAQDLNAPGYMRIDKKDMSL
jgi:hypothetical protein